MWSWIGEARGCFVTVSIAGILEADPAHGEQSPKQRNPASCVWMWPITSQFLKEGGKQHWHHPMDHRAWFKDQERRHHGHRDTATPALCHMSCIWYKGWDHCCASGSHWEGNHDFGVAGALECGRVERWPWRDGPSPLALGVLQGKLTSVNSTRDVQFPPW